MTSTFEWRILRQEDMKKLDSLSSSSFDSNSLANILLEADAKSATPAFGPPLVRNASQKNILLDAVFHLLRFARSIQMTHLKQSTLVSILLELHREAMTKHMSAQAAYSRFEELLLIHSVQRPPHGLAILRIDETRAVAEYLTSTYFRYYTLYLHAFTHRKELTVVTTLLGDGLVETLPAVPPLFGATPLAVFEANAAERKRIEIEIEQRRRDAEEEREMLEAEDRRKFAEAEDAARREVPQGLRAQLLAVKHQVGRSTLEHLTMLEQKVAAIEQRVAAETLTMPGAGSSVRGGGAGAGGLGGNNNNSSTRGGDSGGGKRKK